MGRLATALLVVCCVGGGWTAARQPAVRDAQTDGTDAPRQDTRADAKSADALDAPGQTVDRAVMRERLQRRLVETRQRIAQYQRYEKGLSEALERLDAGEAPREVFAQMRERSAGAAPAREAGRDAPGHIGDGMGRDRAARRMDPQTRRRVMGVLAREAPQVHERIQTMLRREPEQSDRLMQRLAPRLEQIKRAKEEDPERAVLMIAELHANLDLTIKSRDLRALLARDDHDPAAGDALRAQVREALRQSLDAHLAVKQHDVHMLAGRIEQLRGEIDRRQKMRDQFIESQFDRIVSPDSAMHRPTTDTPKTDTPKKDTPKKDTPGHG